MNHPWNAVPSPWKIESKKPVRDIQPCPHLGTLNCPRNTVLPPPPWNFKDQNLVCDCAKVHFIFFHYNFKNWKVAGSLINGNILIVILLQPFEEKLAKEENPDKKEMYKNIVAKATVAIEALDGILSGEKLALEELVKWKQVKQIDIKFHMSLSSRWKGESVQVFGGGRATSEEYNHLCKYFM